MFHGSFYPPHEGGKRTLRHVVDFKKLRQLLGDDAVEDEPEAYEFTWVGKQAARREAAAPISKTLRPVPERSVEWESTRNIYIEGDNLDALKLLQKSYLGKVKMIYIDPPYNTGNDFVYHDDFKQSQEEYDEEAGNVDELGNRFVKNSDSNGRFHSDWCSMIYPRLQLAHTLLSEDGVIFISIDDHEVDNLKKICDEVFGENNFIANIIWQSTPGSNTGVDIITVTENILVYGKDKNLSHINMQVVKDDSKYVLSDEYEAKRGKYVLNKMDRRMTGPHYSEALNYPATAPDGSLVYPGGTTVRGNENWNYRWSKTKLEWGIKNGFVVFKKVNDKWNIYFKQYFKVDNNDRPILRSVPYLNLILSNQFNTSQGTSELFSLFGNKFFDYAKPMGLIKHLISISSEPNGIILDFFSGSATTAHAVMQLNAEDGGNRKFILVQLPEETDQGSEAYKSGYKNICEIGEERIRRAGKKIQDELKAKQPDLFENGNKPTLDTGFRVFRVDSSNMKDVYFAPKDLRPEQLDLFADNVKEDRTDLDLLYGSMVDWGVELSLPLQAETVDGVKVYTVNGGDLVACFDRPITDLVAKAMAGKAPRRVLFRDNCFEKDEQKINIFEQFKQLLGWSDDEALNNIRVI